MNAKSWPSRVTLIGFHRSRILLSSWVIYFLKTNFMHVIGWYQLAEKKLVWPDISSVENYTRSSIVRASAGQAFSRFKSRVLMPPQYYTLYLAVPFSQLYKKVCRSVDPSVHHTYVKFLRNGISRLNLNKIASRTWSYAIWKTIQRQAREQIARMPLMSELCLTCFCVLTT